jgi:hypothetical protein
MTAEQRWILDLAEVVAIRIECSRCSAAVVVKPGEWRELPAQCPACKNTWTVPEVRQKPPSIESFAMGLSDLLEQFRRMKKSGGEFPYGVRLEINDPNKSIYS